MVLRRNGTNYWKSLETAKNPNILRVHFSFSVKVLQQLYTIDFPFGDSVITERKKALKLVRQMTLVLNADFILSRICVTLGKFSNSERQFTHQLNQEIIYYSLFFLSKNNEWKMHRTVPNTVYVNIV